MIRFMCAREFFYRAPALSLVANDMNIVKRRQGGQF